MKSHNPKIIITALVALAMIAAALGACAQATPTATEPPSTPTPEPTATTRVEAIQLTDGLGRQVSLAQPAQKIVSLAPASTEMLFALGAGRQVVGRDDFSDFPAEAQAIASIGGGFGDLNVEAIVALSPDLVLASSLTPPEQIQAIEKLGLTAFALSNPADLDGMYANLKTIGELTGHAAEAEALTSSLKDRVAAVEAKTAAVEERPLAFYELDSTEPDAPWTAGPDTFIDTLITMAGGTNLGGSLEQAWSQISVEQLLVLNPQMIILGDATWGGVTPEDVQARQSWAGMQAVQDGKIFTFDDNLVSRPGPRLVDGLEAFAKLFHPELFN